MILLKFYDNINTENYKYNQMNNMKVMDKYKH